MRWLAFLLAVTALSAENWPGFRGPSRQGTSSEKGLPVRWSESENVAWKQAVDGQGWSSPIVWGDRVFVTATSDDGVKCRVISLDAKSGKVLWDREVFTQTPTRKENKNSYASPTPVTDGKRVYAAFGQGGIAAVDYSGKLVWKNLDFPFYSQHGLGASLVLDDGLLIQPRDASSEGEDKKLGWQKPWDQSFVLALDAATGKLRWKGARGLSRIAHVTPNIATWQGKTQIVSAAGDVIQGFSPADGSLLWTARSQGEGVVPSVVIGGGRVFTASGFEKPTIRAVRLGGSGDVSATHIAWEQTKGVPKIPSFAYVKPYLFSVAENGIAMCLKEDTGEIVWQERIGSEFSASPLVIEDKLYFLAESGETVVIKAGPVFEVLARNQLEGKFQASMAVANGRLYLRSDRHVYSIR